MILRKKLISLSPRLQRLLLKLQRYNFHIQYQPGKDVTPADSLSRLPNMNKNQDIQLDLRVDFISFKPSKMIEIQAATKLDTELQSLIQIIVEGWPEKISDLNPGLRQYWFFRDEPSIEDGVITKGERILIPETIRDSILEQLHTGHIVIEKTKLRAKSAVYWPNVNRDIENMCKQCHICQMFKSNQQRETLKPHEIPTGP